MSWFGEKGVVKAGVRISHPLLRAQKTKSRSPQRIDWIKAKAPSDTVFLV